MPAISVFLDTAKYADFLWKNAVSKMQNSRVMSCSLHIFWIFLAKVKLCQVSSVKVMLTDFRKGRGGFLAPHILGQAEKAYPEQR